MTKQTPRPLVRTVSTLCQVITPGGLIIKVARDEMPEHIRRILNDVTLSASDELAAQTMARLTGCRVTIQTTTQATATPEESN